MTARRFGPLVLVLLLTAAACGSSATDSGGGAPTGGDDRVLGGEVSVGLFTETSGWLPSGGIWTQSGYNVARAIFDPLMAYDETGQVHPYLAEAVESNEDFTQWTIRLRPDVRFHDGTALDAAALQRHLTEIDESPIWGQFTQPIEDIAVVDPLTVVVTMTEPFSTFPQLLSIQPGYVAAPAQYDNERGANEPIGTGPFVFEEWIVDKHLTVDANPDYWREGYPRLDAIEFQVITDPVSRRAALDSGELTMMEVTDAGNIIAAESDDSVVLYLDDKGEGTEKSIYLNAGRAPFDDPDARLAVAHAIDKEMLVSTLYEDRFPAANGPFRPNSPWYQDVEFPDYDPDRAAELAAAYEEDHGEPLSFTLKVLPDPVSAEMGQLVQGMLDDVGIEVEIQPIEATSLLTDAVSGSYQALPTELLFGSQHPDREYPVLHTPTDDGLSVNLTRLSNEDVDAGLEAARRTDDPAGQVEAWKQVQEGLAEESTVIFLVHNNLGIVARPEVRAVQDWTFPDGTPGLPQAQTVIWFGQLWLAD